MRKELGEDPREEFGEELDQDHYPAKAGRRV